MTLDDFHQSITVPDPLTRAPQPGSGSRSCEMALQIREALLARKETDAERLSAEVQTLLEPLPFVFGFSSALEFLGEVDELAISSLVDDPTSACLGHEILIAHGRCSSSGSGAAEG